MGKITYGNLEKFNYTQAKQGALVIAVHKNFNGSSISNISLYGSTWKKTTYFLGAGVVKLVNSNFILTVASVDYTFSSEGDGHGNAANYILKMGTVTTSVVSTGNGVTATTRSLTERSSTGDKTTVDDKEGYVYVDSLTPRDQFAIQALRGILERIDDPSSVSTSVMSNYCDVAYQWAAQMMQAAGNARSDLKDDTATEETKTAEVGSLENNTEKLLNNIVAALEKTDEKSGTSSPAHWSKTGYPDVLGAHDAATASSLPREEGEPPYESVEQAEADGWTWYPTSTASYSERVSIPKLIDWLNNYVKHTPTEEGDTKEYVGLDDLINAIKGISGGGSTGEVVANIGNEGLGRDETHPIHFNEVLFGYRNIAEALDDGWIYVNQNWEKEGYNKIEAAYSNEAAQKLPTCKYGQRISILELPDLITSVDKLTAQVKRIADSMTNSNS